MRPVQVSPLQGLLVELSVGWAKYFKTGRASVGGDGVIGAGTIADHAICRSNLIAIIIIGRAIKAGSGPIKHAGGGNQSLAAVKIRHGIVN